MPKRIGFLYEKVVSPDNCAAAVRDMAKAKKKIRRAQQMKEDADRIGQELSEELRAGKWTPKPYHEKTIKDGYGQKERHIKIPCLHDQCVHHALMRVTAPFILKRNYFYNTGSIPNAGQARVERAVRRWLAKKKAMRYAASLDVHHFFESCRAEVVMKILERIFKDKRFLALHRAVLRSMGDTLAIGFTVSHWYANLVLGYADSLIKQRLGQKGEYGRFMDDMVLLCNNKRFLHKTVDYIREILRSLHLELKANWQVYKIAGRGVGFLSFRFFHGYTVMRKRLMFRLSQRIKRIATHRPRTLKDARTVTSYNGILKRFNSYNYRLKRVYPFVSIKRARRFISNASRVYVPSPGV